MINILDKVKETLNEDKTDTEKNRSYRIINPISNFTM
jgi:hypothetical protein